MHLFDDRCAELIVHMPLFEKVHRFTNRSEIHVGHAGGQRIFGRRIFNVNRHAIHKPLPNQRPQLVGKAPVRIQLHSITERLDLGKKIRKIRTQHRLSAGHANTFQKTLPLLQKRKHFRLVDGIHLARPHSQRGIMAKRTTEIAPAGKNRASHLSRKVQQRQFGQAFDDHTNILSEHKRILLFLLL